MTVYGCRMVSTAVVPDGDPRATEASIRADPALSDAQKEALLSVYRSYRRNEPDVGA